jgi:hypothetical protein
VAAEIVEDDDVAGLERRHENLFDVSPEAFTVDRSIDNAGGVDAVAAQGGKECERSPAAVWDFGDELASARRPAAQRRHVGLGPGFIDEDQPRRVKPALMGLPALAPSRHVGPVLFGGEQSFF